MVDCNSEDIRSKLSSLLNNSFERLESKFDQDIKSIEEMKYSYYDIYQIVSDLESTDDEIHNDSILDEGIYLMVESSRTYTRSKTPLGSKQKTDRDKTPVSRKNTDRSKTPINYDNGVKATTSNITRRLEERRVAKAQRESSINEKKTEKKLTKKSTLSNEITKVAEKDVFERLYKQQTRKNTIADSANVAQSSEIASFSDTRKASAKSSARLRKKSQETSVEPHRNMNKNQSFVSSKSNQMDFNKDISNAYNK